MSSSKFQHNMLHIPPLTIYNCLQSSNTSCRASCVVHVSGLEAHYNGVGRVIEMGPHNVEEEHYIDLSQDVEEEHHVDLMVDSLLVQDMDAPLSVGSLLVQDKDAAPDNFERTVKHLIEHNHAANQMMKSTELLKLASNFLHS